MMNNSVTKGNFGLGVAVAFFTSKGYVVSLPLNDNQDYDLVVDNGALMKIQVKTTFSKNKSDNYKVYLRTIGSSTTGVKSIKYFTECKCDYLFIVTSNGDMYMISKSDVTQKTQINLSKDKEIYFVGNMGLKPTNPSN